MTVPSIPNAGWILNRLPLVAYFSEDDDDNTMRVISGVEHEVFGYPVKDILNRTNFLNESFLEPDDYKVVTDHRDLVWSGNSPVISRFDVRDARGKLIPSLLISQGLYSGRQRLGICGVVCDLSNLHVLQGEKGVLSKGNRAVNWNQRTELPEKYSDSWLAGVLPIVLLVADNDSYYTIRHVSGSLDRLVGHGASEVVNRQKLKGWSTLDPGMWDVVDDVLEEALALKNCLVHRLHFVHNRGERVPILGLVLPYFPADDANPIFLAALMDITDVPEFQGPPGVVAFDNPV